MAWHRTPRGEASTMQGSQSTRGEDTGGTPGYTGRHRLDQSIRADEIQGTNHTVRPAQVQGQGGSR